MSGSNEKLRVLRRIPEIRFDEELRGYNKHQVDRVLENLAPLADEVDVLVDRLSEAERRAAAAEARVMEGGGPAPTPLPEPIPEPAAPQAPVAPVASENFDETLSKTLLLAQRTADATVQEANETAAQIKADAEAEAAASREAVEQEAVSMRAAVDAERSAAVEQANREVAAMIDAARATIDAKVAEAEAELASSHAATRDDLIEQIGSLQRTRDGLALDVEHFEGHLSSRREVLRGALVELNQIVEDPERLRSVMPPTPMTDLPEMSDPDAAHIDVAALDTLASEVAADAEAHGVMTLDLTNVPAESPAEVPADENAEWADEGNTWADDEVTASGVLVDPIEPAESVDAPLAADDAGPVENSTPEDNAAPDDGGEPTQALPVVDVASESLDEGTSDPFLDELRRATSEDNDDEALSKFLNEGDEGDEGKAGWFGRRK